MFSIVKEFISVCFKFFAKILYKRTFKKENLKFIKTEVLLGLGLLQLLSNYVIKVRHFEFQIKVMALSTASLLFGL